MAFALYGERVEGVHELGKVIFCGMLSMARGSRVPRVVQNLMSIPGKHKLQCL